MPSSADSLAPAASRGSQALPSPSFRYAAAAERSNKRNSNPAAAAQEERTSTTCGMSESHTNYGMGAGPAISSGDIAGTANAQAGASAATAVARAAPSVQHAATSSSGSDQVFDMADVHTAGSQNAALARKAQPADASGAAGDSAAAAVPAADAEAQAGECSHNSNARVSSTSGSDSVKRSHDGGSDAVASVASPTDMRAVGSFSDVFKQLLHSRETSVSSRKASTDGTSQDDGHAPAPAPGSVVAAATPPAGSTAPAATSGGRDAAPAPSPLSRSSGPQRAQQRGGAPPFAHGSAVTVPHSSDIRPSSSTADLLASSPVHRSTSHSGIAARRTLTPSLLPAPGEDSEVSVTDLPTLAKHASGSMCAGALAGSGSLSSTLQRSGSRRLPSGLLDECASPLSLRVLSSCCGAAAMLLAALQPGAKACLLHSQWPC